MQYYLSVLKNYATFAGRARRKEYWMFTLFNFIFLIAATILDNVFGLTFHLNGVSLFYGYIYLLYALAVLIPGISVCVRRLHDIGKSGWYFWVALIPIAGAIWLLVLLCTDSAWGTNEYGPNPKGMGNVVQ